MREGGEADLPEVERIIRQANDRYRTVQAPEAFEAYLAMALDLAPRLPFADLLVAEDERAVVGTVTFFPDARDEGWGLPAGVSGFRSMAVDPARQGEGIGRLLLDECVRRARAAGARAVMLHTASWLPGAIALYERFGFARDPQHDVAATVAIGVPPHLDYPGLAFRLDLT